MNVSKYKAFYNCRDKSANIVFSLDARWNVAKTIYKQSRKFNSLNPKKRTF